MTVPSTFRPSLVATAKRLSMQCALVALLVGAAAAQSATQTSVLTSKNPTEYGEAAMVTARVTSAAGVPSGYVTFRISGEPHFARVALSSGVATAAMPKTWSVATRTLLAEYDGGSGYAPSSASVSQTVSKATPLVALTTSAAQTTYGQSVTFTARVSSHRVPWGTVSFHRNGNLVTTRTLSAGAATFTTAQMPVGSYEMTATYNGDASSAYFNRATSPAIAQSVAKTNTTIVLAQSSLNPSSFGQTVSYAATVISATGIRVTGPVWFYRGATSLGYATLVNGSATFSTSALPGGSHQISAAYKGNASFNGSTSNAVAQTVEKSTSTTTLSSSANPSFAGERVILTASVAGQYGGTPAGTVTFRAGDAVLRTVSLSRGAASYATSTLAAGTHSITATLNENASLHASSSSPLSQTIQRKLNATITSQYVACPNSTGITASVPAQSGVTYDWTVEGGTITAGAGTNRITFSTGPSGWVMLTSTLSCSTCATASDSHRLQVATGTLGVRDDLSGDGHSDILWQNRSTGATTVWTMNGSDRTAAIDITSPPAGWVLEGAADANKDGKVELVYRNSETGAAMSWMLNNLNNLAHMGSATLDAPADPAWKFGGVGDFNCDADPDVVWRNPTTGQNVVWLMNYGRMNSVIALPSVSPGWTLAGVGDFTNDARSDLVWRRTTDGAMAIWTMYGTARLSTLYPPAQPDLNWSLQAIADYSNDSRPDLVWRNATTGANEVWLMNGATRTSVVALSPVADPNMTIAGPR